MVDDRRVSTPVKAAHHPSSWCRFVGSGLLTSKSGDVTEKTQSSLTDDVHANCNYATIKYIN